VKLNNKLMICSCNFIYPVPDKRNSGQFIIKGWSKQNDLGIIEKLQIPFKKTEVSSKKRSKALFYFFKNVHIPILLPICRKLQKLHPEIEVAFSYLPPAPQIRAGLSDKEMEIISQEGVRIYGTPQEFAPDITFIADSVYPWVQNCGKLVNVGHGILSKGQYYTDTEMARREEQADIVCVPGDHHAEIMRQIISTPVVATGMAKMDALFAGKLDKMETCRKFSIDPKKKIILFAPT